MKTIQLHLALVNLTPVGYLKCGLFLVDNRMGRLENTELYAPQDPQI